MKFCKTFGCYLFEPVTMNRFVYPESTIKGNNDIVLTPKQIKQWKTNGFALVCLNCISEL